MKFSEMTFSKDVSFLGRVVSCYYSERKGFDITLDPFGAWVTIRKDGHRVMVAASNVLYGVPIDEPAEETKGPRRGGILRTTKPEPESAA